MGLVYLIQHIPELKLKPSVQRVLLSQCRINLSGKESDKLVLGQVGSWELHLPGLLSLSPRTSPSLDSSLSSVLQVASMLPASAFISTPFGASITRDRVGDSNLKYTQDVSVFDQGIFLALPYKPGQVDEGEHIWALS